MRSEIIEKHKKHLKSLQFCLKCRNSSLIANAFPNFQDALDNLAKILIESQKANNSNLLLISQLISSLQMFINQYLISVRNSPNCTDHSILNNNINLIISQMELIESLIK